MLQDLDQCPDEESQQFFIESQKQIMARIKNPESSTVNPINRLAASQSQDQGSPSLANDSSRFLPTSKAKSSRPGTSEGVNEGSSSEEEEEESHNFPFDFD
jgi:hypothetical protein